MKLNKSWMMFGVISLVFTGISQFANATTIFVNSLSNDTYSSFGQRVHSNHFVPLSSREYEISDDSLPLNLRGLVITLEYLNGNRYSVKVSPPPGQNQGRSISSHQVGFNEQFSYWEGIAQSLAKKTTPSQVSKDIHNWSSYFGLSSEAY